MTRFQDLATFTLDDVRAAIARNSPDELPLVPLTVAMISADLAPALEVLIELAGAENALVRGNALISLGHLARRFRALDEARVRPLIETGLADPDASVRALAKSAADEIHQFLHWTFAGHVYG
jgi:HEAT repeat protein